MQEKPCRTCTDISAFIIFIYWTCHRFNIGAVIYNRANAHNISGVEQMMRLSCKLRWNKEPLTLFVSLSTQCFPAELWTVGLAVTPSVSHNTLKTHLTTIAATTRTNTVLSSSDSIQPSPFFIVLQLKNTSVLPLTLLAEILVKWGCVCAPEHEFIRGL